MANGDLTECCEGCRFWTPQPELMTGGCRRHPPLVSEHVLKHAMKADEDNPPYLASLWPVTNYAAWCGEFMPTGRIVHTERERTRFRFQMTGGDGE